MNAALPSLSTRQRGRGAWLLQWRPGERKTIYLCGLLLGVWSFVAIVYFEKTWGGYKEHISGQLPGFGDFIALWSYAKIVSLHPASEIYDFATLHARQVDLGMNPAAEIRFPIRRHFCFCCGRSVGCLTLSPTSSGWLGHWRCLPGRSSEPVPGGWFACWVFSSRRQA